MKKLIVLILLTHLCAAAENINFFGLKTEDTAMNNVIKLIEGLIADDQEEIDAAYARVQELDPELARIMELNELKIPCTRCNGTGIMVTGKTCGKCGGTRLMTDQNSLRFFMDRFSIALNEDVTVAEAWEQALNAFEQYRLRLTGKVTLFGTVIRKEKDGLLLSLNADKKVVHLKNVDLTQTFKGSPVSGTAWPDGTYSYTNSLGETNTVPSYTASIWGN
ncbi:MAG TPA: hypothetical protein VJ904_00460 [Tichowtungia sp.]|nr:hypothetical protein [Tichowtungia sp.]